MGGAIVKSFGFDQDEPEWLAEYENESEYVNYPEVRRLGLNVEFQLYQLDKTCCRCKKECELIDFAVNQCGCRFCKKCFPTQSHYCPI